MTDKMWQRVSVEYSDTTYLETENQKIIDVAQILRFLDHEPPSFSKKLRTASRAVKKMASQVNQSKTLKVEKTVRNDRRDVCASCPFAQQKMMGTMCTQCGCNIKTKTIFATESCPLGKW